MVGTISGSRPDYDWWAKQSSWTIAEASALLCEIAPELLQEHLDRSGFYNPPQKCLEIYETLLRDAENGKKTNIHKKNSPSLYLKWARDKAFAIPKGLQTAMTKFCHLHDESIDAQVVKSSLPPKYCTPDMQLMYDAVEKFWATYDLAHPDLSKAPKKKVVMYWLEQNSAKRGDKISQTLAEAIDTIIRCPVARKGGTHNSK